MIIVGPPLYIPSPHGWPEELGGRLYPEQRGNYSTTYREVGWWLALLLWPHAAASSSPLTVARLHPCSCYAVHPTCRCGPTGMRRQLTASLLLPMSHLPSCPGGSPARWETGVFTGSGAWQRPPRCAAVVRELCLVLLGGKH